MSSSSSAADAVVVRPVRSPFAFASLRSRNNDDDDAMMKATPFSAISNLIVSAAGCGLLSFPFAVQNHGLLLNTLITITFALLIWYTLNLLCRFTEQFRSKLGAFTYEALCEVALGPSYYFLSLGCLVIITVGSMAGFLIIVGDVTTQVSQSLCRDVLPHSSSPSPSFPSSSSLPLSSDSTSSSSSSSSSPFLDLACSFAISRFCTIFTFVLCILCPLATIPTMHGLRRSSILSIVSVLAVLGVVSLRGGQYLHQATFHTDPIDLLSTSSSSHSSSSSASSSSSSSSSLLWSWWEILTAMTTIGSSSSSSSSSPSSPSSVHHVYLLFHPSLRGFFVGIPICIFALACHCQIIPIYAELHPRYLRPPSSSSPPTSSSSRFACFRSSCLPIQFITAAALTFCSVLYLLTGFLGYLQFGEFTVGNILNNYPGTDPLANLARLSLVLHVVLAYPVVLTGLMKTITYARAKWMRRRVDGARQLNKRAGRGRGKDGAKQEVKQSMMLLQQQQESKQLQQAPPLHHQQDKLSSPVILCDSSDFAKTESSNLMNANATTYHTLDFQDHAKRQRHDLDDKRADNPKQEQHAAQNDDDEEDDEEEQWGEGEAGMEGTVCGHCSSRVQQPICCCCCSGGGGSGKNEAESLTYFQVYVSLTIVSVTALFAAFVPQIALVFGLLGGTVSIAAMFWFPLCMLYRYGSTQERVTSVLLAILSVILAAVATTVTILGA